MKFRTELDVKKLEETIIYNQQIMLMGSCFTEHIGGYLQDRKFDVFQNPHGILFNPISIANSLTTYIENKKYTEKDIFKWNDIWSSWDHHSQFSDIDANVCLHKMNDSQHKAHQYLQQADWLIITLGSAFVYKLTNHINQNNCLTQKKLKDIVANCHKVPTQWFTRELLLTEEILIFYRKLLKQLFQFNHQLKIIFTISPVRHLREGLIDNNRSKAVLIQAVHQLCSEFKQLHYFPAYELVIDDLRDYRFYAEDLVHPNYAATEYVWNKLVDACMSNEAKDLMKRIAEINLAFNHKPFNPQTQQHKKFLQSYAEKVKVLQTQHPYLNLVNELNYFKFY